MGTRRLTKSRNHWIDGVIGGVGQYFGINPDLLRVVFLIGIFFLDFNFLIPTYIVLMIFMPSASKNEDEEVDFDSGRSMQIIGVLLILGGVYYLLRYQFNIPFIRTYIASIRHFLNSFCDLLIPVLLIGVGFWIVQKKSR